MTRKRTKRKKKSIDYGDEEDPDEIWDAMDYVDDGFEDDDDAFDDDEEDY